MNTAGNDPPDNGYLNVERLRGAVVIILLFPGQQ